MALAEVKGLPVPDYEGEEASLSELAELQAVRDGRGEWPWITIVARTDRDRVARAVESGRELDVALFRAKGLHAGVLTSPGKMLHIETGGTSRLTDFTTGSWAPRFLALYRHVGLT